MSRILKVGLNKLADWLNGIIVSQIVAIALQAARYFGGTKELLIFYKVQEAYESVSLMTDILWLISFILLIISVSYHWLRKVFPSLSSY
ncbi:MAG: hypothetical protein PHQ86_01795 [Dehalococcoidales bacterium]|nr:hypothetical protein [Dehalococcoidales bacterium]